MTSRLRRRKLARSGPKVPAKDRDFSLVRPLKQLAQRARQVGILRRPGCACVYPIFSAQLGPREVRILTRPLSNGENAIISIRVLLNPSKSTRP
jgi:hypothetical protein